MKRLCIVLVVLALSAAAAPTDSDEAQIRRLHEEQRKAFVARDVDTIKRIFAPDCVITNPFAQFLTVEQTLERVRTGQIDFAEFEREVEFVRIYGDTAIAAGREKMVPKGKMQGAGTLIQLRFTTVWIKRSGQWKEIARHTSRMAPEAK